MRDKLNLPNRKVGGEEERVTLSRYLRPVVVRKDRHSGMEHQSRTLSVVGNETQPETVLVNISTTIRDYGTSPRCSITPSWEVA
ncbi:hypothetical protein [Desulfurobacterium crinifex]